MRQLITPEVRLHRATLSSSPKNGATPSITMGSKCSGAEHGAGLKGSIAFRKKSAQTVSRPALPRQQQRTETALGWAKLTTISRITPPSSKAEISEIGRASCGKE